MKYNFLKYLFFICIVFSNTNSIFSQYEEEYDDDWAIEDYNSIDSVYEKIQETIIEKRKQQQEHLNKDYTSKTSVEIKEFDKQKWGKYNKERDYKETIKEEKEEREHSDFKFPQLDGLGFVGILLKFFIYGILILGISFAIFKLFEAQYKKDLQINKEKKFFIEKLEEQIHHIDLYKLLEEYATQKNFKMMIRINYLIVIKELSNKNLIDWQKQKTNGNYLQEMFGHKFFTSFQKLTVLFERVWFGEVNVDEKIYTKIEPQFKQMIKDIKQENID